jgi:predicted Zn-dependent protease
MIRHRLLSTLFITTLLFHFTLAAQPIEKDKQLGAEGAKAVEVQMGLYDSPDISAMVNRVGKKLVDAYGSQPFDFTFRVVDSDMPNAFALPGGYVYVSRGLLMLTVNEDELAGVMAHEIMHVILRHGIKSQKRSFWSSLALLPAGILGGLGGKDLKMLMSIPYKGAELFLASYSRKQEKEADLLGIELAIKAGYNPTALKSILERISAAQELMTGEKEKFSYFDTHPFTEKRADYIIEESDAAMVGVPQIPGAKMTFLEELEGLVLGQNPSGGMVVDNSLYHPDLGIAFDFPAGWGVINNPVYAGAVEEQGDALLLLTMANDTIKDPFIIGEKATEQVKSNNNLYVLLSEPRYINDLRAYYLAFLDQSNPDLHYHFMWILKDTNVYQVGGAGLDSYIDIIRGSMETFRVISDDERESVHYTLMETVTAREGETVEELSGRIENLLDVPLVRVMNDIEDGSKLKEGQPVKVGVYYPYP